MLEYGSPGQLALSREVEVVPFDDEAALARARPVTPDGKVKLDATSVEARHGGMVRAALASGRCSLVVLGALMTCPRVSDGWAAARSSTSA
jgi:hypothetical protein